MVAYDKFDSVGRLDSSFPDCSFFTEHEQFDRFCSKQMRKENPLHFLSICTPNYTHDAFIRYGLRLGTDVICEKPLVLNPYNIDNLVELEQETGHKAYTILQLRLHEAIAALKRKVDEGPKDKIYDVDLNHCSRKMVLRLLEGRRAQERRRGHQHRCAFLRHAAMDLWTCQAERRAC